MKIVYRAANTLEADIVAGMLRSRGIHAEIGGRHLQTAVGAAAVHDFARVLVNESQYDEALAVVVEYDKKSERMTDSSPSESQDKPFVALGLFTKQRLFWISLILLLYWFLF